MGTLHKTYFSGITYFGSEMILLMTEEGEEPTEMILQSSRWMAFAGKFFISGSFSVRILPPEGAVEQLNKVIFRSCTLILPNCFQQMSVQLVLDLDHLVAVSEGLLLHTSSHYRYLKTSF